MYHTKNTFARKLLIGLDVAEKSGADEDRGALNSYRWLVLAVAVVGQAGMGAATQAIPVLANFYKADFDLSMGQVGLLTATISLGTTVPAIACGFLVDTIGVRPMLVGGVSLVASSIFLLSMAPSYAVALPLAFFAGVGHAMSSPALAMSVVQWFQAKGRGTAMGVKQTGIPVCGAIAAATLPALALAVNWRFATVCLAIVIFGTAAFAFGFYRKPQQDIIHLSKRLNGTFKAMALNHNIWRAGALAFVLVGTQNCIITYLILYLRDVLSLPVAAAGALLSLAQLAGLVSRIGGGVASDVLFSGRRKEVLTLSGGTAFATVAFVALFGGNLSSSFVALPVIVLGISVLGWHGVWVALATELGGKTGGGTALGIATTFSQAGGTLLPLAFGLLLDMSGSYQVSWAFLAVLAASATLVFSQLREPQRL